MAGLKDAGEDRRGVTTSLSLSLSLSFIDCNDTGYAIEQTGDRYLVSSFAI